VVRRPFLGGEEVSLTRFELGIIIEVIVKSNAWVPTPTHHASLKHPCVDGWLFVSMGKVGGIMDYPCR
jgi:hypothetical protein